MRLIRSLRVVSCEAGSAVTRGKSGERASGQLGAVRAPVAGAEFGADSCASYFARAGTNVGDLRPGVQRRAAKLADERDSGTGSACAPVRKLTPKRVVPCAGPLAAVSEAERERAATRRLRMCGGRCTLGLRDAPHPCYLRVVLQTQGR